MDGARCQEKRGSVTSTRDAPFVEDGSRGTALGVWAGVEEAVPDRVRAEVPGPDSGVWTTEVS
jgi:hypothetical protein